MAFSTSAWIQLLGLWIGLSSMNDPAGIGAQEFQVLQPKDSVSVPAGGTLTLTCSVTGAGPAGPVKWLKALGRDWQVIYEEKGSFPRVTRAESGSNTDFTIRINDTRTTDAGVYRCVKFQKSQNASVGDTEYKFGAGRTVSVSDSSPVSPVIAAVGTVCVLVILLLVSVYFYVRMKRDRTPCTARSQAPFPDNMRTQPQASDEKDPDVLYADLQHSGGHQKPQENTPAEHSEYAAIKIPQPIAK